MEREVPGQDGHRDGRSDRSPPGVAEKVQHIAKRVYKVLEQSGYARIDLRLDDKGRVYVLEANPNPQIAQGEDFADSAAPAGLPTPPCSSAS